MLLIEYGDVENSRKVFYERVNSDGRQIVKTNEIYDALKY